MSDPAPDLDRALEFVTERYTRLLERKRELVAAITTGEDRRAELATVEYALAIRRKAGAAALADNDERRRLERRKRAAARAAKEANTRTNSDSCGVSPAAIAPVDLDNAFAPRPVTPGGESAAGPGVRIVGAGVDSLYLAGYVKVQARVYDALEEAQRRAQAIEEGGDSADAIEPPTVELGEGGELVVRSHGCRGFRFLAGNGRWTLQVPTRAGVGAERLVVLVIRSVTLWKEGHREALASARRFLASIHEGEAAPVVLVSRIDLAVDVKGVELDRDRLAYVTRAHKGRGDWPKGTAIQGGVIDGETLAAHLRANGLGKLPRAVIDGLNARPIRHELEYDAPAAEFFSGLLFTGYTFGKGDVVIRAYDKTEEIRENSPDKVWFAEVWAQSNKPEAERRAALRAAEEAATAEEARAHLRRAEELAVVAAETGGYVEGDRVIRFEAQFRRGFLKEFRTIDRETCAKVHVDRDTGEVLERTDRELTPEELLDNLDALWAYAVGHVGAQSGPECGWLSWRAPLATNAQRTRWPVRPEWDVIRAAKFTGYGFGSIRERRRRFEAGELLDQAIGCGATIAACVGKRELGETLSYMSAEALRRERLASELAAEDRRDHFGFASRVELRAIERELEYVRRSLFGEDLREQHNGTVTIRRERESGK